MKKLALIAAILSGTTAVAQADESMYAGIGLGYATQKIDLPHVEGITVSQKKGKLAGKIYAGYQFNENLAVEGAYHYLNKNSLTFVALASPTEKVTAKLSGHLLGLTLNGILPIHEQFSLVGKAGVGLYHARTSSHILEGNDSTKKSKIVPVIGLGGEFKINKDLTLRGEYEYFGKPKLEEDLKMSRLDMFTISLRHTF